MLGISDGEGTTVIDIRVSLDVFGKGLKITEIARMCLANQGPVHRPKEGERSGKTA